MTTSVENAKSSLAILIRGLDVLGHKRLSTTAQVVAKCLENLAGQVAFYESRKAVQTVCPRCNHVRCNARL